MSVFLAGIGLSAALFWVLVCTALCVVAILVVLVIRHFRVKKLLRKRIVIILDDARDTDAQHDAVKQLLADTGYAYDWEQNIFYSIAEPWQRKLGYCSLYDDWATPLGMVYDCEPVRFEYNGKRWLVEFWKGQYGITSGGEIGIYNTTGPEVDIPGIFNGTFYHCASDEEALNMTFTLYKNGIPLFTRADKHWWLTGHVLGEYSKPSSLTMEASISFNDPGMLDAFLEAFRQLGYWEYEYRLSDNTFTFLFTKPRSRQPLMRRGPISLLAMLRLKGYVAEYKRQTRGFINMYEILTLLKVNSPLLYQFATNLGRQKESFKYHDIIRGRLG